MAAGEIGAFAGMLGEGLVVHAPRADISRSSFFNKVRGSYEFSLSEAYKLSRLLGVSLDELHELTVS